jgi:hypothetical protein
MVDSDINSYPDVVPGPLQVQGAAVLNGPLTIESGASLTPSSGNINFLGYSALTSGAGLVLFITQTNGYLEIQNPSATATSIEVRANGRVNFPNTNGCDFQAPFQQYAGITLAGNGIPAIYGATAPTHKTNAAPASTTYASPAAGFYRITVAADVKTATTLSLAMKVTYTDSEGTAQTDALVWTKEGSTTLLTAVVAADRYVADYAICAGTATSIVVADNSGTYTTCDYYYGVAIEQLA